MGTLLMRLAAPMQAWGVSSRFGVRDTCREPTKSGVIGLICAALGRPRNAALDDLSALKMGVRADREGKVMMDYHIAQDVLKASGRQTKDSEPSNRYYLADAVFLAGLEGEREILEKIDQALRDPVWPLFLGRKAFAPASPVWLRGGLHDEGLEEALTKFPLLASPGEERLRLMIEDDSGNLQRNDLPVSFKERRFRTRTLRMIYITHSGELLEEEAENVPVKPDD